MAEVINPAIVPKVTLPSGEQVPCVGMGTFGSDRVSAEDVSAAVAGAIRSGYRMFDCAACYGNEHEIGQVFKDAFDEGSSVGAARAVKAAKAENRIRVVGVDSSQEAVQLMEHGIFQGIVVQKAFKMGYVGVRETVKMLRGENYKKNINSGCQLVTPDNMYTSEIEKLLFPFNTLKTYGDLTP